MGLNIAEFFVKLGIKGNADVVASLKNVSLWFKDVTSSSTQTKVAIAGALYGLERLTANAAQTGANLYSFSTAFGLSTDALQDWQFALSKFGATGEEVQGAIAGIAKAQSDFVFGQGDVTAFSLLGITDVMGKNANQLFTEIVNGLKRVDTVTGMQAVKSLGWSDKMYAAAKNINFERDRPPKNLNLTKAQIDALQKLNAEWILLWARLEKMGNVFIANYGKDIVDLVNGISRAIEGSVNWVIKLMKEFNALKGVVFTLGLLVAAAFSPITAAVAAMMALMAAKAAMDEVEKENEALMTDEEKKWRKDTGSTLAGSIYLKANDLLDMLIGENSTSNEFVRRKIERDTAPINFKPKENKESNTQKNYTLNLSGDITDLFRAMPKTDKNTATRILSEAAASMVDNR